MAGTCVRPARSAGREREDEASGTRSGRPTRRTSRSRTRCPCDRLSRPRRRPGRGGRTCNRGSRARGAGAPDPLDERRDERGESRGRQRGRAAVGTRARANARAATAARAAARATRRRSGARASRRLLGREAGLELGGVTRTTSPRSAEDRGHGFRVAPSCTTKTRTATPSARTRRRNASRRVVPVQQHGHDGRDLREPLEERRADRLEGRLGAGLEAGEHVEDVLEVGEAAARADLVEVRARRPGCRPRTRCG